MVRKSDTNASVAESVTLSARIMLRIVRDLSAENRARRAFSIDMTCFAGRMHFENV